MSNPSKFELHGTPRNQPLNEMGQDGLTTLVGWGIINPFGPTLSAFAIDGIVDPGKELPILHLMLNPFTQEVKEVGIAQVGETWQPMVDLPPLFSLEVGSCPTLLLPSVLQEPDESVTLYSLFLTTFANGVSVLNKVRRFPGDPWNRVEEDANGLEGLIPKSKLGGDQEADERQLTRAEAEELAGNLLEPDNLKKEIQAFMYAWDGSIEFQGGGIMAKDALTLEAFLDYFAMIAMSCRLPDLKD